MRKALFFLIFAGSALADPLPSTVSLEWEEDDLSERLMDGAHQFVERKIAEVNEFREGLVIPEEQKNEVRAEFQKLIGAVDELAPTSLEYYGETSSMLVAETDEFTVHQVRWPVLEGLTAEGLLVSPKENSRLAPSIVLIPDADESPEDTLGIGMKHLPEKQFAARFASAGYRLLIPTTISREKYTVEGDDRLNKSDQTYREWIYRQAFQMGRHVIGYEVQTARAGAKWLRETSLGSSVGVAGYGEGGLVAFFAAAVDPDIEFALVSGYFGPKSESWKEPIYRNIFRRAEFPDVEIAQLITPRLLVIEHSAFPEAKENKGTILHPDFESVEAEAEKIPGRVLISKANGDARGDFASVAVLSQEIGFQTKVSRIPALSLLIDERTDFDPQIRHGRVFRQMVDRVQSLIRKADEKRYQEFFLNSDPRLGASKWTTEREFETLTPDPFIEKTAPLRNQFREEIIGKFNEPFAPMLVQSRRILQNEKWTAWDVVIPVYGEEFFAWGVLVVPNDIPDGGRRPVVVCQHGRNGVPLDAVNANKTAYNDFAARLAEKGYITFSPHNLYRGEDRYRWLDRKANAVGCTLFSFIVDSHERILEWLKTLPIVDGEKIGFYGLSYGGESAMRIPAVLEGYALSICSGDFNQWNRKVAAVDYPKGFMRSIEWEMPYWDMGNHFDYAEMAGLIFPRPFMVERGHHDRVAPDSWVAHEYAKVRWLYAQFGIPEKTAIEFFQGGHSIRGEGTFEFLDRFLKN